MSVTLREILNAVTDKDEDGDLRRAFRVMLRVRAGLDETQMEVDASYFTIEQAEYGQPGKIVLGVVINVPVPPAT